MSLNRRKLLRTLQLQRSEAIDNNNLELKQYAEELISQILRGKYNESWHSRIIPSLFLIFIGMILAFLIIGILLGGN